MLTSKFEELAALLDLERQSRTEVRDLFGATWQLQTHVV